MIDLAWCGGITEARRIAALAEAWQLPVAAHDCTGPLVYRGEARGEEPEEVGGNDPPDDQDEDLLPGLPIEEEDDA
jgi:hypothetical protein